MNFPRPQRFRPHGGLLAIALVMTMLGGVFLAGWVALTNARAMQARNSEISAQRRLMLENSKAYIRQMAQERAFSGNSTVAANQIGNLGPGWGGFDTSAGWSNLKLYDLPNAVTYPEDGYYTHLFPYNLLGLRPGASFLSTQKFMRPASYNGVTNSALDPFNAYQFMKGIFPTLAGDALIAFRKPEGEIRELSLPEFYVQGRFVVRDPASFNTSSNVNFGRAVRLKPRAASFYVQKWDELNPVTANSTTGVHIASQNLPAMPSTFGPSPVAGGGTPTTKTLFRGDLNIVRNTYVPPGLPASVTHHPNCLFQIQTREATSSPVRAPLVTISAGTTTGTNADPWWIADQADSPTYPPPAYPSGYDAEFQVLYINLNHPNLPNMRIYPVVQQVVFLGQQTPAQFTAAADMDPRIFLFLPLPSGVSFKDVRFAGENNRPMVLGVSAHHVDEPLELYWVLPSGSSNANANGSPLTLDWRMIFINEGRHVSCYRPGGSGGGPDSVILTGGILTNWSIQRRLGVNPDGGAADKFKLLPESATGTTASYKLASILPREAWLESYFQLR